MLNYGWTGRISMNESIYLSRRVKDIAYRKEQHRKHSIVLDCAVRVSYQTESQCLPEQLQTTSDALLTIKSSSLISGLTVFVFTLAFFGRAYFRNDFLYNLQFKFTAYGWFEQKPNLKKQYFLDSFTWFACIIVNRTVLYASSFLARVKFRHCYHYLKQLKNVLNHGLAKKKKKQHCNSIIPRKSWIWWYRCEQSGIEDFDKQHTVTLIPVCHEQVHPYSRTSVKNLLQ